MTTPVRVSRSISLLAGLAVLAGASAVSMPRPAFATAGDSIDPDTGYICVTLSCDVLVPRDSRKVLCKKVWPDGDHRKKPGLQCYSKVGGRWVIN